MGRLFPQRPHLPTDVPRVPSPFRSRFGRSPSGFSHLPSPVHHIGLLPPPGDSQFSYYLLRRLCCHSGLALLENQRSPPSEVLLSAQEEGLANQHLLFHSENQVDPVEDHQEQ